MHLTRSISDEIFTNFLVNTMAFFQRIRMVVADITPTEGVQTAQVPDIP